ncbi:MAG: cellobiose phosphorylase [Candidatus Omnitrophica bacterium]|nr:cellobiose phosphorylase [Candidatus Omnitrophota bacterium]
MIYRFIDQYGTFKIKNPHQYNLYLPLTDAQGKLLSAISPSLAGDIKRDNDHFLTLPTSIEDLRSNLLSRREFFLHCNSKVFRLSSPNKNDILEAGLFFQRLKKRIAGLEIEILNFVPFDIPAEVMRIRIKNISNRKKEIFATSFIPLFGRSEKNIRDHRHVSSLLNRIILKKYGIILKPTMVFDERGHKENFVCYYVLGYQGIKRPPLGQFPTLDYFYGSGNIEQPEAIYRDITPVTRIQASFQGKEVCAALRFPKIEIRPKFSTEYVLLMGIEDSMETIEKRFRLLNTPGKVQDRFNKTRSFWQGYYSSIRFNFGDKNFNGWLTWVCLQPTLRRLFGCSFLPHFDYGKGGRGWRDLWQDALTLLLTEPDKAKEIITKSFRGVRLDGSNATIITSDGGFIADRNRINRVWMDHGIWPYLTTRLYIDRTGDVDFLLFKTTYFRDHQLSRAQQIDTDFSQQDFLQRTIKGKIYFGTILEHLLVQQLVQFFNVGKHNIIRLENADWNDGLDMAAKKGESVAFSCMYAHNLKGLCELLSALRTKTKTVELAKELKILLDRVSGKPIDYDNYYNKQQVLDKYFSLIRNLSGEKIKVPIDNLIEDLRDKYNHMVSWIQKHQWLPEGVFNGYYDNKGKRFEGRNKYGMRLMLASQVFPIMSGIAQTNQIRKIWQNINKYLYDQQLGGFRLNTYVGPLYMDLGRAFGFVYGDKENGAFFSHMNVMFANALYRRGFVTEGWTVFNSLYRMATSQYAAIGPCLPEYFDSQGRGKYLFLTGSASWYIYTLLEEVLGVKFSFGRLFVGPKLVSGQFVKKSIVVELKIGAYPLRIIYLFKKKNSRINQCLALKKVTCNRIDLSSFRHDCLIPTELLNKTQNTIRIELA